MPITLSHWIYILFPERENEGNVWVGQKVRLNFLANPIIFQEIMIDNFPK